MARLILALALLAGILGNGCNKSAPKAPRFQVGRPVLSFNYLDATELSISKNDPDTGDRWSAQFLRVGKLGPQRASARWEMTQAPEGMTPTDRLANGAFIAHLLDTLANLRLEAQTAVYGTENSFGLNPPRYWLRWKSGNTGAGLQQEIRLGAKASLFSAFASMEGQVLQVEGAALKMLDYLSEFKKLRHTKLSTWSVDDADRIEISVPGKPKLLAERNSGEWTLPGGKPLRRPIDAYLDGIFHLEIESFEAARFGSTLYRIEALSRSGEKLVLEVDGSLQARASDRPGALFKLHKGALRILSAGF